MKQNIPTQASIRKAYVEEYLKRRQDAEEFARFTELELADFIRKHESPTLKASIHSSTITTMTEYAMTWPLTDR